MASYTIGQIIRLSVALTDSTGAPVDSNAQAVTIKLPDQTTAGPFTPSRDGTGLYHYDYEPQHAGVYHYRFSATTPDSASEGIFIVDPSPFVS